MYRNNNRDIIDSFKEPKRHFSKALNSDSNSGISFLLCCVKSELCHGKVNKLPNSQMMGEVDENGYKYLGFLEGADIMQKEMKKKVRQEYMKRVKLLAKSKLYGGNLIKAVNAWAICVVRYSAEILDWSDRKLKAMAVHETEGWQEGIKQRV